jgi:iron complex transport system substrate-binding protein
MLKPLLTAAVAVLALTLPALAEWTYVDGAGKSVTLPEVPKRIVAHANVAAGLIPLGIRPVGIYVDGPVAEDPSLVGLDLTGIEILGEAWGEIDIEKLAAVQPDIIIAEYWPLEKAYSGMESGASDGTLIEQIAPIAGPAQGDSTEGLIKEYEALAALLGADLSSPSIATDKAAFEASKGRFQSAVAAKPGLTVMAVSASQDALYVAEPKGASELADFQAWGLNLISPEIADDRGYWETLSWELADKHQPDLVIIDDRWGGSVKPILDSKPTWQSVRAAAAGQVAPWPAFWMRNYKVYAAELDKLTATITAADETIGD